MSDDMVYFHVKPGTPAAEVCAEFEACIQSFDEATNELGKYLKGIFKTKKNVDFLYQSDHTPVGFRFDGYHEAVEEFSKEFPGTFRTLSWGRNHDAHARWYASAKAGSNKEVLKHIRKILKTITPGERGMLWPLFGHKKNHLMLAGASGLGLLTSRGPGYAYADGKIQVVSASKRLLFDPKTGEPVKYMKGLEFSLTHNDVNSKTRYARMKKEAKSLNKALATVPGGDSEDLFA